MNIHFLKEHKKNVAMMRCTKTLIACNQKFTFNKIEKIVISI